MYGLPQHLNHQRHVHSRNYSFHQALYSTRLVLFETLLVSASNSTLTLKVMLPEVAYNLSMIALVKSLHVDLPPKSPVLQSQARLLKCHGPWRVSIESVPV